MREKLGIAIRPRDLELMRGLYESRVMTLAHIAAIHFDSKSEAAKKRVQKLKRAGLLRERARHVSQPSVLSLSPRALEIILADGLPDHFPKLSRPQMERRSRVSELTLRHELQVMDVKAALVGAIRANPKLTHKSFTTWPVLNEFTASHPDGRIVPVEPDGFLMFTVKEKNGIESPYRFFLEVDRGSEVQDRLATRAACYRDYYYHGGFAVRCGSIRERYEDYPFRVLFVFPSAERRNNAAEKMLLLRTPIGSQSCLSTYEEIVTNPLGEVWVTPHGYRKVTAGTPYDPERRRNVVVYSRSAERERFVEQRLKKTSLLE